jgi:adenine deaminase
VENAKQSWHFLPQLCAAMRQFIKRPLETLTASPAGDDCRPDRAADRFFVQGYSEHQEMELMVQSDLTPMQVVQSFSKGASEALDIYKELGALAKGKTADLLVLQKKP